MSTLNPLWISDSRAIPEFKLEDLVAQCREQMQGGVRLLSLFGRHLQGKNSPKVMVTAILFSERYGLRVMRAKALAGERYPSLTACLPAAQIYERELWEQTGLIPEGHPWLKPVRFEGRRQGLMAEYPFFKVDGHEIHEVGVGPIHAGVIEPGHFRFMCLGESVQHLEIQLGYQHRGVENLLLRRPPMTLAPLIESICGDSSIAYTWAYCAAIEALAELPVDFEVQVVRGIALELERIAVHLATLGGLATDIAFLQGGGTYGRLRTAIINAVQRICGNRFGRGWLRPGAARGLTLELADDLQKILEAFSRDFAEINALMLSSFSVQGRFQGIGEVSRKISIDLNLSGPVARASGTAVDARRDLPGKLYSQFPSALVMETNGDCWARMCIRMREVEASIQWITKLLEQTDVRLRGCPYIPLTQVLLQENMLCISVIEGVRGPVIQAIETGPQGLVHYKIQDPSLANWFGLAMALRDNAISDFPICNKSFDLSYCGNDL